jgi:hypothetical protein
MRSTIESQYKEIVGSGCFTLDEAQLLSMDVEVHAMSKEEFEGAMLRWEGAEIPLWRIPGWSI